MLRPYFLTLWSGEYILADGLCFLSFSVGIELDSGMMQEGGIVRCEVFGWVDASLESVVLRKHMVSSSILWCIFFLLA
jgi:hypothetical protein